MNSRKFSILFFIFTLVLAAGIVAWVFVINKGTLQITGEAPFSYHVGKESGACAASPCFLAIKPGDYTLTAKKEGYFDTKYDVEIELRKISDVEISFRFIPQINEIEKLPRMAAARQPEPLQLSFREIPTNGLQGLFLKTENGEELIAQYKKPLSNPSFLPSFGGEFILLGIEENNVTIWSLIDVKKKKRQHLLVTSPRWFSKHWFGSETKDKNGAAATNEYVAFAIAQELQRAIPAGLFDILITGENEIMFLKRDVQFAQKSFGDIVGDANASGDALDALLKTPQKITLRLLKRRFDENAKDAASIPADELLAEFNLSGDEPTKLLGVSEDGASVYFAQGEKNFEVKLTQ